YGVKTICDGSEAVDQLGIEAERECDLPGLETAEANQWIAIAGDDGVRIFLGYNLDFHAAFGAGHDHNLAIGTVHDCTYIDFLLDVCASCNQHLVYGVALDVHTKNGLGSLEGFIRTLDDFDAARLATATGVYLGLYHNNAAEFGGDISG